MYYIVYDDFLPPHEFGALKSYLGPNGLFPWNFSGRINDNGIGQLNYSLF